MPGPVRVVNDGQVVRVVDIKTGGCICEFGPSVTGLQEIQGLADFESIHHWPDAVEQRARRDGLRVELPHPVGCERRGADSDFVSLTAVGPDGTWHGYDGHGDPVQVRLPDAQVVCTTEEYLAELWDATLAGAEPQPRRAETCTRA
jgi:hypothetical protein